MTETTTPTAAEREERYARAIWRAMGGNPPYWRSCIAEAHAAMIEADEEIAAVTARAEKAEEQLAALVAERKAETYALGLLAEECGEVLQLVGKSLRFGIDTLGRLDAAGQVNGETPRTLFPAEIGDLLAAVDFAIAHGLFDAGAVDHAKRRKLARLLNPGSLDNLGRQLAPQPAPARSDQPEAKGRGMVAVGTATKDGVFWHRNVTKDWLPVGTLLYAALPEVSDTGTTEPTQAPDLCPGLKHARRLCMGDGFIHDAPAKRWAREFDAALKEEIERLDSRAALADTPAQPESAGVDRDAVLEEAAKVADNQADEDRKLRHDGLMDSREAGVAILTSIQIGKAIRALKTDGGQHGR